jgi:triosephosphate isomerase (TIM)
MKRFLIAGNWKMNLNLNESVDLFKQFSKKAKELNSIDTLIAAPFVYLPSLSNYKSDVILAAQNYHQMKNGAFTGEVSISMLKDFNINFSLVGHSERRIYYYENDSTLSEKILEASTQNFHSILCVGETLEQRQENKTIEVIENQLTVALKNLLKSDFNNISIAYEPVWAIGTGITASPPEAEEVHSEIRNILSKMFSHEVAKTCRIIYGGSMNVANAKELLSQKNIDGGLIGGASLKEEFIDIMEIANKLSL